jgi:hypothetical protein
MQHPVIRQEGALKATEVFVPGAFPEHTYVDRTKSNLETSLQDALDTPGQVISLSGPSKSGKTVLVERVVGRDSLISISGAGIKDPDDVWNRVLDWMDVPHVTTTSGSVEVSGSAEVSGKGEVKIPLIASGEAGASTSMGGSVGGERGSQAQRRGLSQVVDEIAGSEFVVLVDDFHYMDRAVQVEVAKSLKEAVRLGVRIVTAAVKHRGDDVVRANPELRGRVRAVDLNYWKPQDLLGIATLGFGHLNAELPEKIIKRFLEESAGSPQLMQLMCLHACFVLGLRSSTLLASKPDVTDLVERQILEQTSSNTDFRSLVDVLDAGPKTRGTERKTYAFKDGAYGDVYRCVLRAMAADPPRLSFAYDQLLDRVHDVCAGESPVGSSVSGTCLHMSKLAQEKFPNERAIDWDEQKQIVDLPDPYLLFYLRWSGRLLED